ncbi:MULTISPECIES: cupin [unclassified Gordonia (in: high G+C Gram-positive bacteria)]|uniref:cupin n=1 Tax=unclassified Gordonia (in: high G+C Gram-positive bacteria) TaxID=2657482 RepID=UPI001FFFCFB4|nr:MULTISPECIES: cupin [unclassified Gordonia (in: high G+C Gram-positive bacteria)]UQE77118.1 cupin [Gordonia sp. PP30]
MSVTDLPALADELLAAAHDAPAHRASATVRGHGDRLRETVIALVAGQALHDHSSPGEATLQVLRGTVRLTAPGTPDLSLTEGQRTDIPPVRHGLAADTDAVVLLTVAL